MAAKIKFGVANMGSSYFRAISFGAINQSTPAALRQELKRQISPSYKTKYFSQQERPTQAKYNSYVKNLKAGLAALDAVPKAVIQDAWGLKAGEKITSKTIADKPKSYFTARGAKFL